MQGSIRTLLLLTIGSFLIITWITAYIRTLSPPSQNNSIQTNATQQPGTSNHSGSALIKNEEKGGGGEVFFLSTVRSAVRGKNEMLLHAYSNKFVFEEKQLSVRF